MNEKITFEEHQAMGKLCKIFNEKLIDARGGYKTKNDAWASNERKAIGILIDFIDKAEAIMFKDHPELATTEIYYGRKEE